MTMFQDTLTLDTRGEGEIVDLTPEVRGAVEKSGIRNGLVHLFVNGSTAALTTIEHEPGVLQDLRGALSRIAPDGINYQHDTAWGDGNGRSHVKAALVGPSLTLPLIDGALGNGTWQQVVLLELDVRQSRHRTVHCTIIGE